MMGIVRLTETHWPGCDEVLLDKGSLLIDSGRRNGKLQQGFGLVLSKELKNSLKSYRSEYSFVNKLAKKSSKRDDRNWALSAADNFENAASKGQEREIWKQSRLLS
jgi:hypothetical protein